MYEGQSTEAAPRGTHSPFPAPTSGGGQPEQERPGSMIFGVPKFEQLFRKAASLDVDKEDLKRLNDFVRTRIHDLLVRGVASARANGRDIIAPHDLPITKGLQESMHAFRRLDEEIEAEPVLAQLAALPWVGLDYDEEVRNLLPELAGGITTALARTFRIMEPGLRNPRTEHWEKAEAIFEMLL